MLEVKLDDKIFFGKYCNYSIREILDTDKNYIKWATKQGILKILYKDGINLTEDDILKEKEKHQQFMIDKHNKEKEEIIDDELSTLLELENM